MLHLKWHFCKLVQKIAQKETSLVLIMFAILDQLVQWTGVNIQNSRLISAHQYTASCKGTDWYHVQ